MHSGVAIDCCYEKAAVQIHFFNMNLESRRTLPTTIMHVHSFDKPDQIYGYE